VAAPASLSLLSEAERTACWLSPRVGPFPLQQRSLIFSPCSEEAFPRTWHGVPGSPLKERSVAVDTRTIEIRNLTAGAAKTPPLSERYQPAGR
jgi:hypothetical protein